MDEMKDPEHIEPARQVTPPRGGSRVPANGRAGADPEGVRQEIDRTRARMSHTLDEIEDELLWQKRQLARKKDEIWAKATLQGVRRKITTEPWRSIAIAFAVGYVVAAIRD